MYILCSVTSFSFSLVLPLVKKKDFLKYGCEMLLLERNNESSLDIPNQNQNSPLTRIQQQQQHLSRDTCKQIIVINAKERVD